ncbi:NAD(P)-dependent oxidoreductase [Cryobacterium sp. Y50]|uniref:NAD(P)-dependent oxidoreductase n=1 Tax=Cryobacterium sp. Y50 TaxID=2048286 RepID=UPI000CE49E4D|nr:NAD(P)-dependent oxidoreductase [Cryobacterium sp. Y50]
MSAVAFIGLGTMGQGMVANLVAGGHDVTVWNRSTVATDALPSERIVVSDSIAKAVAGAEFVMYALADDVAVTDVVLGARGIAASVDVTSIVIDLSTISPAASAAEAAAFSARGVRFLDAPVFGSKGEAANGGLWIVVGGDEATFESSKVVLEPISATMHYMGPSGNGAKMKLVGNLVVAAQLEALGESLSLAKKAGLNLHDVLGVFSVTDFRSPIFDGVGSAVIADDYSPSFALKLMLKDGNLVKDFAESLDVAVPGTMATVSTIERAFDAGYGEENASALIKVLASDAGVNLAK